MTMSLAAVQSQASVMVLRKALDAQVSEAQALLEAMPPPASPGKGVHVDVRA